MPFHKVDNVSEKLDIIYRWHNRIKQVPALFLFGTPRVKLKSIFKDFYVNHDYSKRRTSTFLLF